MKSVSRNHVIAIDGPSASGKGTLARALAKNLGFAFMDTGALYRAAALILKESSGDPSNPSDCTKAAQKLLSQLKKANDPSVILENPDIRTDEISQITSKLSQFQPVRDILLDIQKNFAKTPPEPYKGAILDGRDIGTVVCPDADIKLFITASTDIRAKRRTKELQSKGITVTYEAVFEGLQERDRRDSMRKVAPTVPAVDAIILDTSDLNQDDVFQKALGIIKEKCPGMVKTAS